MPEYTIKCTPELLGREILIRIRGGTFDQFCLSHRDEHRNVTVPQNIFQRCNAVPDQVRATKTNLRICFELGERNPTEIRPASIVFILESPHKSEYCSCCFRPLRPLNNDASFRKFAGKVISKCYEIGQVQDDPSAEHDIVLCNPIQYQTSLHHLRLDDCVCKPVRNNVFRNLINTPEFRSDFEMRVTRYAPFIIIDCSTKDISNTIPPILRNTPFPRDVHGPTPEIFKAKHPSYWKSLETAMPIRLTHTPTTCWMYPVARIKRGIGRRLGPACDSQQ